MSALKIQVGGGHYKDKKIQPIEYIHANGLNYIEGAVVKYITRWRDKNGLQDLEKIKHYIDLLIELEGLVPMEVATVEQPMIVDVGNGDVGLSSHEQLLFKNGWSIDAILHRRNNPR